MIKIYIYSPSLHYDLYQNLIKCFTKYIPFHIIPNILIEEDIDEVIGEIVNNKDFERSDTDIEAFDNIKELKYPQENKKNSSFIFDNLNDKEINNDKIQAMFKRGRHNHLSIFIISQEYYELLKRTIRVNGIIYHIFKTNKFRDVQNLYQDQASSDMTINEIKYLTSTCCNEI